MALLLACSLTSFAETNEISENDINTEVVYETSYDEFDICTITITIFRNGVQVASATASNNQGNCDAAEELALATARLIAG